MKEQNKPAEPLYRFIKASERLPEKWSKQIYAKALIIGKHLNVKIDSRPAYGHFFQIGNLIKFEYQGGHDNDGYSGCVLEDEFDRVQWLEKVHSADAINNPPSKGQMLAFIEWISNYGNDENEDDNIELTSHEWYWGRDRDGDRPIANDDLYDLFISTKLDKMWNTPGTSRRSGDSVIKSVCIIQQESAVVLAKYSSPVTQPAEGRSIDNQDF